jgi:LacI family transcriptional regulator
MEQQRRRGGQGVTIRDVAARAGVSPMTVSRVINNENNVSDTTRIVVSEAIRALNYAPNPAARRLAGSESFRIGMLYSNPSMAFLSEFLLGALDESSKTGHQLVVEKCGVTPAAERSALSKLLQGGVQGVILPPPLGEAKAVLAEIARLGVTAVAVGCGQPSTEIATMRMDNYKAARDLTAHLLSLGHRHIGFIKGHPNQTISAQRLWGFHDALAEAGLDPASAPVEQGYFNYRSGLSAAEKLLSLPVRPTAIFAANDDMAAATVATAHRLGLSVPGDLSVAGFDDTAIASTVWPALTTIRQPISAMGRASVSLLLEEMKRRNAGPDGTPGQHLLRYALIRRESTTAPGQHLVA